MPLTRCESDGKPGWKFGQAGACYTYTAGDDASERAARRKAVQQALAIGGGKPPADLADVELADEILDALSDADVDAIAEYADGPDATLPDGVVRCTMNGTPGFRGSGGPTSACHIHDGSPAGIRSAIAKAVRDRGTANPPPRAMGEMETVDLVGVELLSTGGPVHGTGSAAEGDYFSVDDLRQIAAANRELADEVRVPIKIGHSRSQKLLRNSGLYSDEQPAGGWIENPRVVDNKLIGDLKRVPRKLADLMKTGAFRTRSVELSRITSQTKGGKVYPAVVTALALLGAKAPAVRTLDDVLAWYSEADPEPELGDGVEAAPVLRILLASEALTETGGSADTTGMTTPSTTAAPTPLTDEQITTFAQAFGIEEEDAEKRRAAVLAKFAEHGETTGPTTPPTPPAPAPAPEPAPAPPTGPGAQATPVALSADETREMIRAEAERLFNERTTSERVAASVDVAIRQGRIEPAKREAFLQFGARDPQGCLDALVAIPVNERLFAVNGGDGNPSADDDAAAANAAYDAYAAATGVTRHNVPTGGSQ